MEFIKSILADTVGIKESSIQSLLELVTERKISKNEFLIQEGQTCNFVGFVKEGVLRSFVYSKVEEHNNDFYFPNTIACALTSFLTSEKTNCNIQALSDSTIFCLSRQQLDSIMSQNMEWLKLSKYISDTYFIRKCKRETTFLKDQALERFKLTLELFPNIEQLVSQYHIASYLGIKPQSLSRLKSSHR
ncbi:Crp/Fnr family transcriptional regulator [Chryseobacterium sp. RG1]|uniref:Crp/Fnr family transcriptional regulator n=1 Tax=Chryseobacterium tagetis TaxID=2801334 RepID=A0ABS7ZXF5_9FLAO|nr:Crp/Fnr family transcriptional regulator [Chryseobacterium tagetis]MCA6066411.1 Crp/Fnr family transcriptional regulator [Chryseobacterium tagetis]